MLKPYFISDFLCLNSKFLERAIPQKESMLLNYNKYPIYDVVCSDKISVNRYIGEFLICDSYSVTYTLKSQSQITLSTTSE